MHNLFYNNNNNNNIHICIAPYGRNFKGASFLRFCALLLARLHIVYGDD